jgi:hypothetical protein
MGRRPYACTQLTKKQAYQGYPPQQGGYPQSGYPAQGGYQQGYQPNYPPQQGYAPQQPVRAFRPSEEALSN